ncbi:hypothetical protein [Hymenobacter psychrophilus]|uniref:Outer membrane protein beta-barrel domain-containing protein n=1 Tax=Hymenobacter psychrophilus TaxID=651662 RepID=A0A1H3EB62_9BACT|nr:hypothetical protein [Hymenobacter psychrophilus]SDX75931.1 hypothetical protein SAMN04488069_10356 [Hymenobacter psychrophilus]
MKAPPLPRSLRRWPLLLAAAALPLAATAQTAPPDSAATYKHQLGLTASPVLDGFFKNNRSLPVGLLYKRQTKPNQALRLGLVLNQNYARQKSNPFATNPATRRNILDLQLYVGREWQCPLTRRWVAYAGLDAGGGYDRFRNQTEDIRDGQIDTFSESFLYQDNVIFATYHIFIRPLVGVRYQLHNHLYISAETNIISQYSNLKVDAKNSLTRISTGEVSSAHTIIKNSSISTFLRAIGQVTLHYCFK